MREILISQLNVLVLLAFVFLASNIRLTSGLSRNNSFVECTISTTKESKNGVIKTGFFIEGTDCEEMRSLAEEGKPLPTIEPKKPSP